MKSDYYEEFHVVLDHIYEAVCIIDNDYVVKYWNKSAEKLYGYKKDEIIGRNIKEKFSNALLAKTLEENKGYENIKHKPNKDAQVIISTSPIVVNGRIIGAISTDRDISEVEKLSRELNLEKDIVEDLKSKIKELSKEDVNFENIIGNSKEMIEAIDMVKKVGKTDATILLTGESGTGKDVFARAIHKESGRKGSFIPINSSAIPDNLLESELFGYEKGAFTGAEKTGKAGKFELADQGTIFLDEIGDMPIFMQAKLLRVLQDGIVYRVGGSEGRKVNARILAATNKNLEEMMKKGEFREDLYYRLNVVSIELQPLRNRKEDIGPLVTSFISEFSSKNNIKEYPISKEALDVLVNYSWKGNIRELRNIIERMVILNSGDEIGIENIPIDIIEDSDKMLINEIKNESLELNEAISKLEIEMIKYALEMEKNNKAKAAKRLGIKRSTLYYKMDLYKIEG